MILPPDKHLHIDEQDPIADVDGTYVTGAKGTATMKYCYSVNQISIHNSR